jgi:DNA-directed RNA polymerase beta subunit
LYDDADMPTTSTGIKPDMIFNPISLVTRMTTGVIFEGMLAKLSAHLGSSTDATMFKKLDTDNIADQLKKHGFKSNGTERLYNGMTGNYLDAEIFIAPLYYQTLQKYTSDTVYANGLSPSDVLTRQPLHGKRVSGGARMGSMETSCLSVASINFLHEKMTAHSDGIDTYVCANCGSRATANEDYNIFKCNVCLNNANIQKVKTTHTSNLFLNELEAMSVGTSLILRKPVYEEYEE